MVSFYFLRVGWGILFMDVALHLQRAVRRVVLLFDETFAVEIDSADAAQGLRLRDQVCSRRHEVPGLAVGFEETTDPASVGIKGQALEWRDLIHRNNVPNVCRNDVGNEEVNLGIPIGFGIAFRAIRTGGCRSRCGLVPNGRRLTVPVPARSVRRSRG